MVKIGLSRQGIEKTQHFIGNPYPGSELFLADELEISHKPGSLDIAV